MADIKQNEHRELIATLDQLLSDERGAIASLNVQGLQSITERKAGLVGRLEELARTPSTDPEIRRLAAAVRAKAEASAMLLTEAVAMVQEALGHRTDNGTYDQNAHRTHTMRAIIRRAA